VSLGLSAAEAGKPTAPSCWGEVSAAFAQLGEMGAHAADPAGDGPNNPDPRLGLANVARAFFDQGIITEPTLQALGHFLSLSSGGKGCSGFED
jgi:hypothetical protein